VTINFQFNQELGAAEQAARDAGAAIMALFRGKYDVQEKSKNNPVTTADLEANRIIRERIASTFPDDGWLSEEDADSERRLALSRVWVVDPIDGTKEFIEGVPQFAISIGFVVDGVAQATLTVGALGRGEVELDTNDPPKPVLTFDPRGREIAIAQGATILFSHQFPQ